MTPPVTARAIRRAVRPAPARRRLGINWALVEQRRIAAGISRAELADRVGTGTVTGPVRLWRDAEHHDITLGVLERLCAVLDLHPVELFTPPPRREQRPMPAAPAEVAGDDVVVEAALLTLAVHARRVAAVGRAALAAALGWTLPRLGDALARLGERLDGTGVRVDVDVVAAGHGPVHGLRPRDGVLTAGQRRALYLWSVRRTTGGPRHDNDSECRSPKPRSSGLVGGGAEEGNHAVGGGPPRGPPPT